MNGFLTFENSLQNVGVLELLEKFYFLQHVHCFPFVLLQNHQLVSGFVSHLHAKRREIQLEVNSIHTHTLHLP